MGARFRLVAALVVGLGILATCGTPQQPDTDQLAVTLTGAGSGAVVSEPAGIDTAAGELTGEFAKGATVTLTTTPDAGSSFTGFSGVTCEEGSGDATCVVTVNEDTSVTATFALIPAESTLTVTLVGDGTVTSDPAGIDSEAGDLEETYLTGSTVTLTVQASGGGFAGWTGSDCDGLKAETCIVTVGVNEPTVTAYFNSIATLIVTTAASGDDAVEFLADSSDNAASYPEGWVLANFLRLDLGSDPDYATTETGLRFANVGLPAGANVREAVLTLSTHPELGTAGDLPLVITGQLATDAGGFPQDPIGEPSFDITGHQQRTTSIVPWTISGAWTANQAYDSDDIATVVREIVAPSGWDSDGTVVLFLSTADPANTASRRV